MPPLAPLAVGRIEIQLEEPTPSDVEFFLSEQGPEHRPQNYVLQRQVEPMQVPKACEIIVVAVGREQLLHSDADTLLV